MRSQSTQRQQQRMVFASSYLFFFLLLALDDTNVATAFSSSRGVESIHNPSTSNPGRATTTLVASSKSTSASTDTTNLSGLIQDMLQAKREIKALEQEAATAPSDSRLPPKGPDGVYRIGNRQQLEMLHEIHAHDLVIVKFSSPMCQACRMLQQKFRHLAHKLLLLDDNPNVVLADISVANNPHVANAFRDYVVQELHVQRIPTLHLYAPRRDDDSCTDAANPPYHELVDTIDCRSHSDEKHAHSTATTTSTHSLSTTSDTTNNACSWTPMQEQIMDFIAQFGSDHTVSHSADKHTMEGNASSPSLDVIAEVLPSTTIVGTRRRPLQFLQKRLSGYWRRLSSSPNKKEGTSLDKSSLRSDLGP